MKSPILILFIIFNLLAINLVSANSEFDEETVASHLLQSHTGSHHTDSHVDSHTGSHIDTMHSHASAAHNHTDNQSIATTVSCADESSCDHCCHISAHMIGFITRLSTISTVTTSVTFDKFSEQLSSLAIAPPYHPPQA